MRSTPMATSESEQPPDGAGRLDTGWRVIARNNSVVEIIDALLDMPPHREFNQSELAEFADVSRKSVHNHLGLLLDLDIVTEVPNTSPQRFRFNPESDISQAIVRLDGAVNNAGPGIAE